MKSFSNESTISETGNWNVADTFAHKKIMDPLNNCDFYERIAIYGYDSLPEELMFLNVPIDELRVKGLNRLINELIMLCKNCMFAMKKDKTKENLETLQKNLEIILDKLFPLTYSIKTDQSNHTNFTKINKPIFDRVLQTVSKIKSEINTPLNRNHLIFTDKEEFDPRAFKDRIKDRMINKG